jgi:sortase A
MNKFQKNFWVGVALILLGIILIFGKGNNQSLNASFEGEPVDVTELQSNTDGLTPKKIIIPELNIDIAVRRSEIIGGYWEVFNDLAGWGMGSGHPGEAGNQVIFAHAREGLFLPLKDIRTGVNMYIVADEDGIDRIYAYSVIEIKEVYPNQTEVIKPTEDETLTLYTCSGYSDEKRLIVVAKRVKLD